MRNEWIAAGLLVLAASWAHGDNTPQLQYRVVIKWSEPAAEKGKPATTAQTSGPVEAGSPTGSELGTPLEGRYVTATVRAYPAGDKILVEIEAASSALFEDSTGDAPRRATIRKTTSETVAPGDIIKLELEKVGDRAKHYTLEICVSPSDSQAN